MSHSSDAAALATGKLVKQLCAAELRNREGLYAQDSRQQLKNLQDHAFDLLLGLAQEDVPYVSIDDRPASVQHGLATAASQLQDASYPELAARLEHLVQRWHGCSTCAVLGTEGQALSGRPVATPLTEQPALLALLLELRGSRPSVRRRQSTFQQAAEATKALQPAIATASFSTALASGVFSEAPDPHALTDISMTVVLLPSECGYPTDAMAGASDVSDLTACMEARPVWAPASLQGVLPPESSDWLPMPPALLGLRGDVRRGAAPSPLRLSLSTLSMGDSPGSATAFQAVAGAGAARDAAPGGKGGPAALHPSPRGRAAAVESEELSVVGSSGSRLWSLEESEQARDALQALQGVHSALMRLRAMAALPSALPRRAAAGILRKIAAAAALRQQLQRFVQHHTAQPPISGAASSVPASAQPEAAAGVDSVLRAFAVAVGEVLRQQAAELAALEERSGSVWFRSVAVAGGGGALGKVLHGRGMSLLQVAVHTGGIQLQLRALAELSWCTAAAPGDPCRWEVQRPPAGAALLQHLYAKARTVDGHDGSTVQYLFASAAQPYLEQLRRWALSLQPWTCDSADTRSAAATLMRFESPPAAAATGSSQHPKAGAAAVPAPLPEFLAAMQTCFLHAGCQLRFLHSVAHPAVQRLVAELAAIGEMEQGRSAHHAGASSSAEAWLPGADVAIRGVGRRVSGGAELLITAERLQAAAATGRAADAARQAAVAAFLAELALETQTAQDVGLFEAAVKADSLKAERLRAERVQQAALLQQCLAKEALLLEQRAGIAAAKAARLGLAATEQAGFGWATTSPARQPRLGLDGAGQLTEGPLQPPAEQHVPGKGRLAEDDVATTASSLKGAVVALALAPGTPPSVQGTTERGLDAYPALQGGTAAVVPLAEISAAVQTCAMQPVQSQYHSVSTAAVRFVLDHLGLLPHLHFMRQTFFQCAGDWADALLLPLAEQVGTLLPLNPHALHAALEDSVRASCMELEPLAAHLDLELLPGPTAVTAQLAALQAGREQRDSPSAALAALPRGRTVSPLLVPPSRLDALDCVLLRYKVGWPLSAVLTEDTMTGYAAVFTAMLRVRRVSQALKKLREPLAMRSHFPFNAGSSSAGKRRGGEVGNGPQAAAVQRRLQRLRAFAFAAAQFVAAVQTFQAACTSGDAWVHLLAKLVVSSEERTNAAVARGQGLGDGGRALASMGGVGKAAAAVVARLRRQQQRTRAAAAPGLNLYDGNAAVYSPATHAGAAATCHHAQHAQYGLADLQELLDLHRAYVTTAAADCLTFCGRPAAHEAAEAALQAVLEVAVKLEAAVLAGRGAARRDAAWGQALLAEDRWRPLAGGAAAFEAAAGRLRAALADEGTASPLGTLSAVLG